MAEAELQCTSVVISVRIKRRIASHGKPVPVPTFIYTEYLMAGWRLSSRPAWK